MLKRLARFAFLYSYQQRGPRASYVYMFVEQILVIVKQINEIKQCLGEILIDPTNV